jgi:hypothetical protein
MACLNTTDSISKMVTYLVFLLYPVCMLKILLVLFTKKERKRFY